MPTINSRCIWCRVQALNSNLTPWCLEWCRTSLRICRTNKTTKTTIVTDRIEMVETDTIAELIIVTTITTRCQNQAMANSNRITNHWSLSNSQVELLLSSSSKCWAIRTLSSTRLRLVLKHRLLKSARSILDSRSFSEQVLEEVRKTFARSVSWNKSTVSMLEIRFKKVCPPWLQMTSFQGLKSLLSLYRLPI